MLRLRSTRQPPDTRTLGFPEALTGRLPPDGGLYLPVDWPRLPPPPDSLGPDPGDTAAWAAPLLFGSKTSGSDGVDEGEGAALPWGRLARAALDFPIPRTTLGEELGLLELFHGPTLSFKDVGARVLARALAALSGGPRTILTATSGDTGGAVAAAVAGLERVRAAILFPRGRVSEVQRRQFTTRGDRVLAIEVGGVFDDCQALARKALSDQEIQARHGLVSANSLNPGRLLPQVLFYLHLARLQGWREGGPSSGGAVIVPSGNLGNLTAGVLAARAGAPIGPLVAACNRNDALVRFQADGRTRSVTVRPTASSAMDVGVPSNLERLEALFPEGADAMRRGAPAFRVEPGEARDAMQWAWRRHGVLIDPHTAVGVAVARRGGEPLAAAEPVTVLATAHPAKFPEAVREATGETPAPPEALGFGEQPERVVRLEGGLEELDQLLRGWAG